MMRHESLLRDLPTVEGCHCADCVARRAARERVDPIIRLPEDCDEQAIIEAIRKLQRHGGGIVQLPQGEWPGKRILETLGLCIDVQIAGASRDSTTLGASWQPNQ